MKRQLPALTLIAALAAAFAAAAPGCSSDSGGMAETTGGTTAGSTAGNTDAGSTDGTTTGNEGGSSKGAWFGTSNFGEAVVIIDDSNTLYALSSSTSNTHEAVTGTVGMPLERFLHRDSDNTAFGDSFTLVGDIPSQRTPPLPDTVTYNLAVANDGQQLNNTGAAGDFSLTFATSNDIEAITLADLAGTWRAQTSYCTVDCDLELNMTFDAAGAMTGNTMFNGGNQLDIAGAASVAANSTQHLSVSFTWNSFNRTGIIYKDRGTAKIVLNSFGPDNDGDHSFTAKLTRQ